LASVLPPGAGNEDEDVLDTGEQGPKKGEEVGLEGAGPVGRELDSASIGGDGDGHGPAITTAEQSHDPKDLHVPSIDRTGGSARRISRSLRAISLTRNPGAFEPRPAEP